MAWEGGEAVGGASAEDREGPSNAFEKDGDSLSER